MTGPLSGIRVVEFAGLGPTPFAAMLLADFGADVIRIERKGARPLIPQDPDFLNRGRASVKLDLKSASGLAAAQDLLARADGLIEGMRPGVMEKLGLGPDEVAARNPKLVYGRMTGWGQDGPRAGTAGHDINYISLTGLMHATGPQEQPEFPLNLLGDFGGGGIYLAFGMLAAFIEAGRSGRGQVVDAAILDGTAHLGTMIYSMRNSGFWQDRRRSNLLDGAAPFYRTYECACGGHVAVGAIEPKFWDILVRMLGLAGLPEQMDRASWPELSAALESRFLEESRDHWARHFEDSDACVTPVLSLDEARSDPQVTARRIFTAIGPRPAPLLSASPARAEPETGPMSIDAALARWREAR